VTTTVLAFDCSAAHCAAALLSGHRIVGARAETMARGQAERLMPMLAEVLEDAGLGYRDLSAIGVGIGPGNFTGLRIAVAAARGLSLGLGVPAVGITRFEAIHAACSPDPFATQIVSVAAPRDHVYLQRFAGGLPVGAPDHGAPGDCAAALADVALVLGHRAAGLGQGRIPAHPLEEDGPPAGILVAAIARLASRRLADGAPPRPAPLYVRAADAAPARPVPPVR